MDKKAQTFAPFELLIGVILAFSILIIIISAIEYFKNMEISVSHQRLIDGFLNAVENVTKKDSEEYIIEKGLKLKESSYSTQAFSQLSGGKIEPICIEFQSKQTKEIETLDNIINIKQLIQVDVYYKCIVNYNNCDISCINNCDIYCIISFGKKPNLNNE